MKIVNSGLSIRSPALESRHSKAEIRDKLRTWRLHPQPNTELGSPLAQLHAGNRRSPVGCPEGTNPGSSTQDWPCPEGSLSPDSWEMGLSLACSLLLLVPKATRSIHLGTEATAAWGKATSRPGRHADHCQRREERVAGGNFPRDCKSCLMKQRFIHSCYEIVKVSVKQ